MKTIKLFSLLILNSLLCLGQNSNNPISFRNFVLDKISYSDCINILKNKNEFKYKKIKEYSNGYYYWINEEQTYPSSGFADNDLVEKFNLKKLDSNIELKCITCKTDLLENECEMQLYFFNDTLAAIAIILNSDLSTFTLETQLDDKYGKKSIEGAYDYPNIQEDWHTYCLNWCYSGHDCDKAIIGISEISNVCDIFLGDSYISTHVSGNVLSYRGRINYERYKDYKDDLYEKAKIELEVIKKKRKLAI